ncbi:hypothetical protein HSBAA_35270 [Vreelandella sulfidaeris]|uniref:FDX-ACB domain-containing protein n=1 Tax=Vreelandella sulfidaeris TaxID=115553 RepID=A0A455UCA9_9GAMM|nr:hypothetical protein HSBAA_35270 [Halomonas sulfidaeris]
MHNGEPAGWIGTLHPQVRATLGLKMDAVLFEVRLDMLSQGSVPAFEPLSRFPEVRRDLAFILKEATPVQSLLDCAREQAGITCRILSYLTFMRVKESLKAIRVLRWA